MEPMGIGFSIILRFEKVAAGEPTHLCGGFLRPVPFPGGP